MLLTTLLACSTPSPPPHQEPAYAQDHVLLYWIPYDNDLSAAAGPVLEGLRAGTEGSVRVQVAAQVDLPTTQGMKRISFVNGVGQSGEVPATDSGSPEALRDFLDWAAVRYQARRYTVAVLDHGGRLDQLARDDDPGHPGVSWLSTPALAAELRTFDAAEPGELTLVFLQVCGKATLETAWVMRGTAQTLLASQLPLGAPNTYYTRMLQDLAAHPEWDGQDIAQAIGRSEQRDMFAGLSCVDLQSLSALPEQLRGLTPPTPPESLGLQPFTWTYANDAYVDLRAMAGAMNDPSWTAFSGWVDQQLMCGHFTSQTAPPALTEGFPPVGQLSGLSLWVPPTGAGLPYPALSADFKAAGLDAWANAW